MQKKLRKMAGTFHHDKSAGYRSAVYNPKRQTSGHSRKVLLVGDGGWERKKEVFLRRKRVQCNAPHPGKAE